MTRPARRWPRALWTASPAFPARRSSASSRAGRSFAGTRSWLSVASGLGGEEQLLAIDLAATGWGLAYVDAILAHHHPSPVRDRATRRRCVGRNDLWTSRLRRPARSAGRQVLIRAAPLRVTRRRGAGCSTPSRAPAGRSRGWVAPRLRRVSRATAVRIRGERKPMKALTWQRKRSVAVEEVPDPTIQQPTDAIVRITSTGICGSDLHLYEVLGMLLDKGDILGHEPMGVVEAVGGAVMEIRPGDRVVIPFNISCGDCFMCDRQLYAQRETTQVREHHKGAARSTRIRTGGSSRRTSLDRSMARGRRCDAFGNRATGFPSTSHRSTAS